MGVIVNFPENALVSVLERAEIALAVGVAVWGEFGKNLYLFANGGLIGMGQGSDAFGRMSCPKHGSAAHGAGRGLMCGQLRPESVHPAPFCRATKDGTQAIPPRHAGEGWYCLAVRPAVAVLAPHEGRALSLGCSWLFASGGVTARP